MRQKDAPENFLRPRRLPGDPPWFRTVPPARLVAVRTEPSGKGRQKNRMLTRKHSRTKQRKWTSYCFTAPSKKRKGHIVTEA